MRAEPEIEVVAVERHVDLDEGKRVAVDLARRRAQAALDLLAAKGVEPGRLLVEVYESTRPVDTNATRARRAHNRRVQFRVERRQGQ
jgi:outer membrane protein OmpA-like peptidoglycan-associated protein